MGYASYDHPNEMRHDPRGQPLQIQRGRWDYQKMHGLPLRHKHSPDKMGISWAILKQKDKNGLHIQQPNHTRPTSLPWQNPCLLGRGESLSKGNNRRIKGHGETMNGRLHISMQKRLIVDAVLLVGANPEWQSEPEHVLRYEFFQRPFLGASPPLR